MPTVDELRARYGAATDEQLREAMEAGADAYNPDAWVVIREEAGRRGVDVDMPAARVATPVTDEAPSTVDEAVAAALTPSARRGQMQAQGVAGILLLTFVVSAIFLLANGELRPLATLAVGFGITLSVCVKLLEGRAWARWLLAVVAALRGGTTVIGMVGLGGQLNTDLGFLFGWMGAALLGASGVLLFSPNIAAFVTESTVLRDGRKR